MWRDTPEIEVNFEGEQVVNVVCLTLQNVVCVGGDID